MVIKFFLFSILTFNFFLINNQPSNAFNFKMSGAYECRLGWSWIKTSVYIDGYHEDATGTARMSSVDVGGKSFIDYHLRQDKLMSGKKTPYLVYMINDEKRIIFEFRQSSQFRKYDNDGLVVVIEKIKFNEKEGSKIEKEVRYCKKVY